MKIVVLVKHVPDATGERGFAADGTVDREATDGLLSELDEYAVEQALQLAEDGDDVEVVAMTLGPDDAADAIKRSLQMGATRRHPHQRRRGARLRRAGHQHDPRRGDPQGRARPGDLRHGLHRRQHGRAAEHDRRAAGLAGRHLGATLAVADGTVTIRRDGDTASLTVEAAAARRGQRDRPVRRGPLPVDEGHPGRQEEAGRDLGAGRPGSSPARSAWRPPGRR